MKKLLFLLALAFSAKAQISLDHTYSGVAGWNLNLSKFHVSGYKYTEIDMPNLKIYVYNLNHTLFKTISIPSVPGSKYIYYISENLFDTDNLIEYAMVANVTAPPSTLNPTPGNLNSFYIYKENGTQMMLKDSASLAYGGMNNVFNIADPIYFDGTSTKMKLSFQQGSMSGSFSRTEVYTLPGTIPCIDCTGGTVTGVNKNTAQQGSEAVFYPNPVTDQLKLSYELPKEAKTAEIKIHDIHGRLIEELKVTSTFDFIYLPSNYNNGLYLYTLLVDGKVVKTEKIVLDK